MFCSGVSCNRLSGCIDVVVVASDDAEILQYARSLDAHTVRLPPEMAEHDSPVHPVLLHAVEEVHTDLSFGGGSDDMICYLRATSPFTRAAHIREGVRMLRSAPSADSVVAVKAVTGAHPSRFKDICTESGLLVDAFPAFPGPRLPIRSETLAAFVRNGALVVTRPRVLRGGRIWGAKSIPLVMSDEESLDIDTPHDFAFAEWLFEQASSRFPSMQKEDA